MIKKLFASFLFLVTLFIFPENAFATTNAECQTHPGYTTACAAQGTYRPLKCGTSCDDTVIMGECQLLAGNHLCYREYPVKDQAAAAQLGCNSQCLRGPNTQTTPVENVIGQITPPQAISNIGFAGLGISQLLTVIIRIIYMMCGIAVLFMFVLSAWQWITSGGDKESVAKAQKRIQYAVMGIVFLALTYFLIEVLSLIVNIPLLNVKI